MAYDINFQAKVFPVLMSAFDTYLSNVFDDRLYNQTAPPQTAFPVCIYQSQDGGGKADDKINLNGWRGNILFRSVDMSLSGAWDKLEELTEQLPLVMASGYEISLRPLHSVWFPIDKTSTKNIYTAAIVVEVGVYKS